MASISDFTDTELWSLRTVVKERYGKEVGPQPADAERRLDPGSATLALRPAAFWCGRGANFTIFKVGENRYRRQFFYKSPRAITAPALLQVQADHERDQALRADKNRNP